MRDRLGRLFRGFTVPLWIGFIWSSSSIIGNALRIGNAMNAVWCFIQTSRGNVVLLVVCVLLLIGVVTWPEIADSDEENRSFRAEDDQSIAERRWQKYCAAGDRHESRKRLGYRQHHFVSVVADGSAGAKFA